MAFEKPLLTNGFTAASAMDSASMQFCLVKLNADGTVNLCTAATDIPIGVLQNMPSRGQLAEVGMLGISKVRVGAADLSGGELLSVDSTSRAAANAAGTGTTAYVIGRCILIDNADNDAALVTATIDCLAPNRGA